MANVWMVGDQEEPSDSRNMDTFAMKRLELLASRVKTKMAACQETLEKILTGEEISKVEQIEVLKLQVAADNFICEVKDQTNLPHTEHDNQKLEEHTNLHFEAQDLLSTIQIQNQPKQPLINHSQTTSRLPKLDLMKFSGDQLRWHEFWDGFSTSIDKRTDLSAVDKLSYLVNCLEGGAKEAVSGLALTNSNYQIALEELREQYGRPEIVIDAHYRELCRIPKAGQDISECNKTRAEIEKHLKVLSTMGEPVNTNNQLRSMIMDKFPDSILYNLRMLMKEKGHTVEVVRQGLKDIINAKSENAFQTSHEKSAKNPETRFTTESFFSSTSSTDNKPIRPFGPGQANRKRPNEHNKQLPVREHQTEAWGKGKHEPPKKRLRMSCIFCKEAHYNDQCTKFRTVAERKERIKGRCFICFSQDHKAPECNNINTKSCYHCKSSSHNRSLCPASQEKAEHTTTLLTQSETNTILQTATAHIFNEEESRGVQARLLLDTGSQKTYLTEAVAKKLKLDTIEQVSLTIFTFGQLRPKCVDTRIVDFKIKLPNGDFIKLSAHVIPTITGSIPSFYSVKNKIRHLHPEKIMAEDSPNDCPADVLVGNDYYHTFFSGCTERTESGLYLLKSKLGWIPSGKMDQEQNESTLSFLTFVQKDQGKRNRQFAIPDPPLQDDKIRDLWELECIGIKDSPKILDEDEVIKHFVDTTKFVDGRYYVKWPWAQFPSDLSINFGMSLGRLTNLLKRSEEGILNQYDAVLKDQLEKGIIEIVEESKLPQSHPVHYLPHHCVVQENKTTKLRIVYDASSKSAGHASLNEYLFKGPLMLEDLVSLLLVFRTHPIGIVADIEKAFLQIGLQEEDRDVTRFLWVKDLKKKPEGDNLIHFRFCRVPFGVISSPYLLAATIRHHLMKLSSTPATKISNSLYVDNLVTGATTLQEAVNLYTTATSAFDSLSMNIREWNSNSEEFLKQLPNDRKTVNESSNQSVLGLKWNTNHDTLMLSFDPATAVKPIASKREILRTVASVYDPCGLVAPLLLAAKLFLQNLWHEKFKWDTILPQEKIDEWEHCALPLQMVSTTSFPRYYSESTSDGEETVKKPSLELHCFTDASKEAYSAAVYLRSTSPSGIVVNLVISRTRLIPFKNRDHLTIPKRELLGVLIGTRLVLYARRILRLPISHTYLWTDSSIVLGWLKSSHLLQPFVSKRVSEVNAATDIKFRYVTSENNPADIATRPQYSALPEIWLKGPQFLMLQADSWVHPENSANSGICLVSSAQEEVVDSQGEDEVETDYVTDDPDVGQPDPPLDIDPVDDPELSLDSFTAPSTQNDTIRTLQLRHFPKEMAGKSSSLTKPLGLFIDQAGILRCTGRLQNANLRFDQTHPILLPKSDPFTLNVIKQIHEDNHHIGVSHTLAQLRQNYWVPQGRSQVQSVLKRCKVCIKYGGGPYKLPPMPPLPAERVRLCSPFTYTGLDYLGPLTIREGETTSKRWCCIFVCMASRAVRLELIKNVTAEEFLLCFRRFVAAQGAPLLVVSDNAAQFKLVAEVITSPLSQKHKTAWHFIPELSPWQGGFYERLVALVKHCLRRSLDKNLLTDSQLSTVLKEVETVLNSRPLTYVGKEFDVVLRPSDYLANCGTHPLPQPEGEHEASLTATKAELIDGWKRGKNVLAEFTSLFQKYYLTNLRERAMTSHKQQRIVSKKTPLIGDAVQIWDGHSKFSHRTNWKVGTIVALLRSQDGCVRTAQVRLENGTLLNRSISYLYPLELDEPMTNPDTSVPAEPLETNNNTETIDNQCEPSTLIEDGENNLPNTTVEANPGTATSTLHPVNSTDHSSHADDQVDPTSIVSIHDTTTSASHPVNERKEKSLYEAQDESSVLTNDDHLPTTRSRRQAAHIARQTIRRWTQDLCALSTTLT